MLVVPGRLGKTSLSVKDVGDVGENELTVAVVRGGDGSRKRCDAVRGRQMKRADGDRSSEGNKHHHLEGCPRNNGVLYGTVRYCTVEGRDAMDGRLAMGEW